MKARPPIPWHERGTALPPQRGRAQSDVRPGSTMMLEFKLVMEDRISAVSRRRFVGVASVPGATLLIGLSPRAALAAQEASGEAFPNDIEVNRCVRWMSPSRRITMGPSASA